MTFSNKVCVLIFADQNRVRSMFLEFFVDCRGGSIFTYADKVCVVICAHQNTVRSMFLEFLLIVEGGRTPDKRIPEGLF